MADADYSLDSRAQTPESNAALPERTETGRSGSARLRLLVITDTDLRLRGGSERFLTHLLGGLDPRHFEIDVIQLDRWENPALPPPFAELRGQHLRLAYRPVEAIYGPRAWRVWRMLYRRIRAGYYDIIQSQHEKSDLLCALLPRGPHGALRVSNRRDTGFQKSAALRALFLLVNHRFDYFLAPAQAILDALVAREGVPAGRARCLPNAVDCQKFQPTEPPARLAGRARLGLPLDGYLFGTVARMEPVKRHEDMISAFAEASRNYPWARLVLIGRGSLEGRLRDQARAAGVSRRVIFLGESGDVETLLPLLDAFVMASSTEGLSNAILEAMACGLPTIATGVGGNPELVEPGRTGLLVPPCQPGSLARAMGEILADPEAGRNMGRRARQRAETEHAVPTMIAAYAAFYRSARKEATA